MSNLRSLADFNAERRQHAATLNSNAPSPNGIACPECGVELFDSQPNVFLTSDPPMKSFHCPKCGHTGLRIA